MKKIFFLILFFTAASVFSQSEFIFTVAGNYTTTAKIYLFPQSADPVIRNFSFPLEHIFSPSFELRYKISDEMYLLFATEMMSTSDLGRNLTATTGTVTSSILVEDGFELIPLELNLAYLLPFSTSGVRINMYGGVGYYIGKMTRLFGDAKIDLVDRKTAYGIQVGVSLDYFVRKDFSLFLAMKFRDPQFNVSSKYDSQIVNYDGNTYFLPQTPFETKINVDGVTFSLGTSYKINF